MFDHIRAQRIWHPTDILAVNVLLNALSSNSEAAFERCKHHLGSMCTACSAVPSLPQTSKPA